jgi:hypothetical protein
MRSVAWDRAEVIARLKREVWRYLSAASRTDDDVVLDAAALLQMPASEVRSLAQIQFIMSEPVASLLAGMPMLSRRLTTTTREEVEVTAERVRGPIRWSQTLATRGVTGMPQIFVTAPSRRAFGTPENEVLVFALHAIANFGRRTGWHRSTSPGAGDAVRRRVAAATRWVHIRSLADISARVPSPTTISRVRSGRNRRDYRAALDVFALYTRYVARLDRPAIREAVERHALVTSREPVLLELLCLFNVIAGLSRLGWNAPAAGLLRPPLVLRASRGDEVLRLFYQHAPPGLREVSVYRDIQRGHRFGSVGGLIPDLVIQLESPKGVRWVLIEVKGVERALEESARAAAHDLLAYRRAFDASFEHQQGPYGIGIGWGRDLKPVRGQEIVLCSPDTIPDALEMAM